MIIVLKPLSPKEDIERVENMVKARGLDTHVIEGAEMTIIGCIGDTSRIDAKLFEVDPAVTKVMHVQEPYKLASRAFHPDNSIIDVSGVKVGGDNLALIAGPCSVESVDQVLEIAKAAKASGANMLRGGAFKPSPDMCACPVITGISSFVNALLPSFGVSVLSLRYNFISMPSIAHPNPVLPAISPFFVQDNHP